MFEFECHVDGTNERYSLLIDEIVESFRALERGRTRVVECARVGAHNLFTALLVYQYRFAKAQSKLFGYVEGHMFGVPYGEYRCLLSTKDLKFVTLFCLITLNQF